jgi:hypothetical protein
MGESIVRGVRLWAVIAVAIVSGLALAKGFGVLQPGAVSGGGQ